MLFLYLAVVLKIINENHKWEILFDVSLDFFSPLMEKFLIFSMILFAIVKPEEEGALMLEWFQVVNDKNVLLRFESELVIQANNIQLEDRQARLENDIRALLTADRMLIIVIISTSFSFLLLSSPFFSFLLLSSPFFS